MKKFWLSNIITLIITTLILIHYSSYAQTTNNDTNKIASKETDEIANMLDSIAILNIFPDTISEPGISLNPFFKLSDSSNMSYYDSIYRSGLYFLSLSSPFEYVYNENIKSYIELYGIKKAKLTSRMLGLGELYFPLFEEYLDKYKLPLELKYLAIIESALNPMAKSRAGAAGIWQFMLNTGKKYGLNVTSYVDERNDPLKSTIAACQHLSDLYNLYKDWALVLAAYNAGAGNVNKAILRAKLSENEKLSFWKIKNYLPRETQNYVPAFIGVSYVMTYYKLFGITPVKPDFAYDEIDTLIITQPLSFKQICEVLCVPEDELKFLNPTYKKGFIPASENTPYILRLRKNYITEYIQNEYTLYNYNNEIIADKYFQQIAANSYTPNVNKIKKYENDNDIHIVKKGESLNIIARKYNCSVSQIMKWNNLKNPMVHPNQKLLVKQPNQNNNDSNNIAVNNNSNNNNSDNNKPKIIYHTIRKGDTLWGIANQYEGVTVDDIKKLNNIKENQKLMPGQKLKIAIDI